MNEETKARLMKELKSLEPVSFVEDVYKAWAFGYSTNHENNKRLAIPASHNRPTGQGE